MFLWFQMLDNIDLILGAAVLAFIASGLLMCVEKLIKKKDKVVYRRAILVAFGSCFGLCVWGIHFLGMQNYLPDTYSFKLGLSCYSYFIVVLASVFSAWVITQNKLPCSRLLLCSLFMGTGISGMHYLALMAVNLPEHEIHYDPIWVILLIVISIIVSGFSLWFAFKAKNSVYAKHWMRVTIFLMLVISLMGLYYTGMTAASFYNFTEVPHLDDGAQHSQEMLLLSMMFFTCVVLASACLVAVLELRLEERNLQLLKINEELENLTLQDNLTKLPNRLFLQDHIEKLFQRYKLTHQKFALIYLDLDFFKAVNDNFGYQVGDHLLVALTERLQSVLDDNQILLRLGGDEFLIILPQIKEFQLESIAEKILVKVQERFLIEHKQINISASLGIVLYPDHGQSLHDLLTHADTAKMLAKEQGRNTFCIYSASSEQYFQHRHQSKLINDLYRAVDEQQFVLYYQAKFLADYQICGAEALIRWQHPTLGLLAPNRFIEAAEQTGLIIRMGYWALEQACMQLHVWHEKKLPFCQIAVNLSAVQFEHKHLVSTLDKLIKKYKIQPKELVLEITESTAMHHIEKSICTFERLRALGVLLAIDDFGTGHSSFLYLKDLPVDELKIDREFIRNLCEGSKDEIILESIIHLAIRLGLVVTAEGVETEQQAEILKRLGCQQLQGYLLGKPMPIQCLEAKYFAGS